MNKIIFLTLLIVAAFFSNALAEEIKIAHINFQKALNYSVEGKKAMAELEKEIARLRGELDAKQEELKKLRDDIEKKTGVWTKETKEEKEKEFQKKSEELQKQARQYDEEINWKIAQREKRIKEELLVVIKKVAKDKGYKFVLESSIGAVLYAPDEADITDEVMKEYDKGAR